MDILELSIRWRSPAGTHHLVVGEDGVPHLTEAAPTSDLWSAAWDPAALEPPPRPPARVRPRASAPKRGKPWSEEEEAILRDGFAADEPHAAIAERIGRTPGAVLARLVKLGLVEAASAGLRFPPRPPAAGPPGGVEELERPF